MSIEIILLGAIVIVVIFDRFLNTTLENSFSDEKIMIGKPGFKKKKIKTKALLYLTIIILLLAALFVPKSLNLLLINKTNLSFLELLFWISLHLLTLFYCYSVISNKINFKKLLAKEILFLSLLTTISIVANLSTSFLNDNYEITLKKSSTKTEEMSEYKWKTGTHYRLRNTLPMSLSYRPETNIASLKDPINVIYTKKDFLNLSSVKIIRNYEILNVNYYKPYNHKYTLKHYWKAVYIWGNHPYNVLSNYIWKINLSKSIKDSAVGIIFYVGFIFRGILLLLFGVYQLNKWALVNLKDNE